MIYIYFVIGFIAYCLSAFISHLKEFHSSVWYYVTGITIAVVANILWLTIAKNSPNSTFTTYAALYWDIMISVCFLIVPLLLFDVKLSNYGILGVILILVGIGLTKL